MAHTLTLVRAETGDEFGRAVVSQSQPRAASSPADSPRVSIQDLLLSKTLFSGKSQDVSGSQDAEECAAGQCRAKVGRIEPFDGVEH